MTLKKSADTIPSFCVNQGHGVPRGILLVNLGSPASPSIADVRRYLGEFLMDPRVIDSPWLIRKLVVSAFILPFRPKTTARAYQSIWEPTGSPLLRLSAALRDALGARISSPVALAMRYGEPSIPVALAQLLARDVDEILLIALYPHHADSTRTTTIDAVTDELARLGSNVGLDVLPPFYAEPDYLDALTGSIRRAIPDNTQLLLFSYHGLPERHLDNGGPDRRSLPEDARLLRTSVGSARHVLSPPGLRDVAWRRGPTGPDERSMARQLPVAAWPTTVVEAVYRRTSRRAPRRGCATSERRVPVVRRRQSGNPRRDRHQGP